MTTIRDTTPRTCTQVCLAVYFCEPITTSQLLQLYNNNYKYSCITTAILLSLMRYTTLTVFIGSLFFLVFGLISYSDNNTNIIYSSCAIALSIVFYLFYVLTVSRILKRIKRNHRINTEQDPSLWRMVFCCRAFRYQIDIFNHADIDGSNYKLCSPILV